MTSNHGQMEVTNNSFFPDNCNAHELMWLGQFPTVEVGKAAQLSILYIFGFSYSIFRFKRFVHMYSLKIS